MPAGVVCQHQDATHQDETPEAASPSRLVPQRACSSSLRKDSTASGLAPLLPRWCRHADVFRHRFCDRSIQTAAQGVELFRGEGARRSMASSVISPSHAFGLFAPGRPGVGYEFGLETSTANSGESGIRLKLRTVSLNRSNCTAAWLCIPPSGGDRDGACTDSNHVETIVIAQRRRRFAVSVLDGDR